jgi:hypothetical protein
MMPEIGLGQNQQMPSDESSARLSGHPVYPIANHPFISSSFSPVLIIVLSAHRSVDAQSSDAITIPIAGDATEGQGTRPRPVLSLPNRLCDNQMDLGTLFCAFREKCFLECVLYEDRYCGAAGHTHPEDAMFHSAPVY